MSAQAADDVIIQQYIADMVTSSIQYYSESRRRGKKPKLKQLFLALAERFQGYSSDSNSTSGSESESEENAEEENPISDLPRILRPISAEHIQPVSTLISSLSLICFHIFSLFLRTIMSLFLQMIFFDTCQKISIFYNLDHSPEYPLSEKDHRNERERKAIQL
jgi:hypothetical protein